MLADCKERPRRFEPSEARLSILCCASGRTAPVFGNICRASAKHCKAQGGDRRDRKGKGAVSDFRAGKFEREKVPGWARGFCPAHSSLSLLDIDLRALSQSGKKLILLDVDNT